MIRPTVTHRQISDVSPLDELASLCIRMMLCAAQVKNVALRALIRLASEELAAIEGHEAVAEVHARLVRINHERKNNTFRAQAVRR